VEATLEGGFGPHEDIGGGAGASQNLIREAASVTLGRRFVWDDDHQIVVAVGPCFAARPRAEKVDAFRLIGFYQAMHHLGQKGIVKCGPRRG
jgi:hypothetical protein